MSLTIWCNTQFNPAASALLRAGCAEHHLLFSGDTSASVLDAGKPDPALTGADVAFGQPVPEQLLASPRLRWTHVSTAGYTRFDRDDLRANFTARGVPLTTSSTVFADSCAQHVLAMMLALGRQLPQSLRDQWGDRAWGYFQRRYDSRLLTGQRVLLLGFGTIAQRLAELLAPFRVKIWAVRRRSHGVEGGVDVLPESAVEGVLPLADHVVNLLPDNASTRRWCHAARFAQMKRGARFYNVGRGTTVDEAALLAALRDGPLDSAYLDVFETEPLPRESALWAQPNCFISPHTAGGRHDQDEALVAHFLANLARLQDGRELLDRVI